MFDFAQARRLARRSKKYWVPAVCTASFACGNFLFGDDDTDSASLLSQYQQATQQLVTEVQPSTARRNGPAPTTNPHSSRLQPVVAQAAGTATPGQPAAPNTTPPQQKSSRRVKPTQQPAPESAVAKADVPTPPESTTKKETTTVAELTAIPESPANTAPLANAQTPATPAPSATVEPSTPEQLPKAQLPTEQLSKEQLPNSESALTQQHVPIAPPAADPPPAAAPPENKSPPKVTYIPPQSEVTQKQLPPRMEILTPATVGGESPRAQDPALNITPFVATRPVPMQSEVRPIAPSAASQPLPQIINISRPAVAPLEPPKLASTLAELNNENLPPIVSPDQVPRPGTHKKPLPQKPLPPAAKATPILRIDLGKK